MNNPVRILIVDDHRLFREGLVRLLEVERDIHSVAGCATIEEAVRLLTANAVDVVLLDFDLGQEDGLKFFAQAAKAGFTGKVLVLTAGVSQVEAYQLMGKGAAGILLKHNSPELLVSAINKVMNGELCLDERFSGVLAQREAVRGQRKVSFTERDRLVLRGVFEGLGNKEIGQQLNVSESAVKASLQQLFRKTGVRTRAQLVRIALERYRDEL